MSVLTAVTPLMVNSLEIFVPNVALLIGNVVSADFSLRQLFLQIYVHHVRRNAISTMLLAIHQSVVDQVILILNYYKKKNSEQFLNELGRDGWELISVVSLFHAAGKTTSNLQFFLKRKSF